MTAPSVTHHGDGAEPHSVDVVVVGAGLAGLMTARLLRDRGLSTTVVEARDRVGGRLLSENVGGATFDLGGQWIGPAQRRMHALVAELGIETFPTYASGKSVLEADGKLSRYSGDIPRLNPLTLLSLQRAAKTANRAATTVDVIDPAATARADELDSQTLATWRAEVMRSKVGRAILDAGLRVVFGAETDEISALWALYYIHQSHTVDELVGVVGCAQETRFATGAQTLPNRLAAELGDAVRLSTPVRRIRQDADGVNVFSDHHTIRARRVVFAAPPAVADRVDWGPALPSDRAIVSQRMPMGATTKHIFIYSEPFWRNEGLSGEAVLTSGPVSVIFDNCSSDGSVPALLAFSVGNQARTMARLSIADRRHAISEAVGRCFGPRAMQFVEHREQDWQAEEWTRGCPTGNFPPGVLRHFGPSLRAPWGRVHWAGTESAREFCGFMEGAVESAERVVDEIATDNT